MASSLPSSVVFSRKALDIGQPFIKRDGGHGFLCVSHGAARFIIANILRLKAAN